MTQLRRPRLCWSLLWVAFAAALTPAVLVAVSAGGSLALHLLCLLVGVPVLFLVANAIVDRCATWTAGASELPESSVVHVQRLSTRQQPAPEDPQGAPDQDHVRRSA